MSLLILSLAPVFIIASYIYFRDKYEREPMRLLLFVLLAGAITAVPAHAIFGITMGFYFGMAKFYEKERQHLKMKALLYPILLHGTYNFILFTGLDWLTIVFIAFVIFLYISGLKRVKKLSAQSIYKTDFELLNQKFDKNTVI